MPWLRFERRGNTTVKAWLYKRQPKRVFLRAKNKNTELCSPAQINSHLNVAVRTPTPFGLGRNGCWPSRGSRPRYPGHSPLFFRFAAPWTTAEGQLTASSKSVARFLFFFLLPFFVSFSWWVITFIPPWPNLSLLCVRWKCDLAGQVSAMLHLLQMGPFKVLTTFPLQIQSSWQLSLLELLPLP